MVVVAITRQGLGDIYAFKTFTEADEHPLVQFGDAIIKDADDIVSQYNWLEMPALGKRLGLVSNVDETIARLRELDVVVRKQRMKEAAVELWKKLQAAALPPPGDPSDICKQVTKDRRTTKSKEFIMAKGKKKVENQVDEITEGAEGAAPAEKKTRSRQKKYSDGAVIHLLNDKEGKQYGPENNPKRAGSASAERFSHYRDGMTFRELLDSFGEDAAKVSDDLAWDIKKGFISVEEVEAAVAETEAA